VDPAAFVMLERGPCFGRCPVYTVGMDASGLVQFKGGRDVKQPGEHRQQRDPAEFAALLEDLARLGAFELDQSYTPGGPNCQRYATDMPSTRIEIRNGPRHLAMTHYLGCRDAPAQLRAIEDLIDQRTDSANWIKDAAAF
jgi:hypothetical protein